MGIYFDVSVGGWVVQQKNVVLTFLVALLVWMDSLSRQGITMANGKQKLFEANVISSIKT